MYCIYKSIFSHAYMYVYMCIRMKKHTYETPSERIPVYAWELRMNSVIPNTLVLTPLVVVYSVYAT